MQTYNPTIPVASINPSSIVLYKEIVKIYPRKYFNSEHDNRLDKMLNSKRSSEGILSKNSLRKIGKALDYLLYLSSEKKVFNRLTRKTFKFKIAFITLTLSSQQIHSDNEIRNKLLNQLLTELRTIYNVENYIWKAEKQKNGNIHFHILVDKFIPWWELRNRWNRIQNKLGYVDRYQQKMKKKFKNGFKVDKSLEKTWSAKKQYESYKCNIATDYQNPNSVDIHSLYKIKNIKNYLGKYISKNVTIDENTTESEKKKLLVEGRIWGCNQELGNVKGAKAVISQEIEEEISELLNHPQVFKYKSDYYTVIYASNEFLVNNNFNNLVHIFKDYIDENFNKRKPPTSLSIEYNHTTAI